MDKRSPWFKAKKHPPVNGDGDAEYEHYCIDMHSRPLGLTGRRSKTWLRVHACDLCSWRGFLRESDDDK